MSQLMLARPWALFALLPLAWLWWSLRKRPASAGSWQRWIDAHLLRFLLQTDTGKPKQLNLGLLASLWLIACIAWSGPSLRRPTEVIYNSETARVVLLDLSPSMDAEDIKPTRLARARLKILDWLKRHNEGHIALMVYAGSAHVVVPFSTDVRNLSALVPSLTTQLPPRRGSDPVEAFRLLDKTRKNAGFARAEVLWITDGLANDQVSALTQTLKSMPLQISIMGIGTAEGAPVHQAGGGLLSDSGGHILMPRLDWPLLQQLATQIDARLTGLSADDSDLDMLEWPPGFDDQFSNRKDNNTGQDQTDFQRSLQWQDLGGWLTLLMIPLALWAFSRRRLFSITVTIVMLHCFTPTPADAGIWQDLWKTPDQQATDLLQQAQAKQAASLFTQPDWRGVAHYRDNNFSEAEKNFAKGDQAKDWYNRGNAQAKAGQLQDALHAYDEALKRDPHLQVARDNRQAVEAFMKKQPPSKQQGNKDNKDQNQDKDQKQDKDQNKSNQQADNGQNKDNKLDGNGDHKSQDQQQAPDQKSSADQKPPNQQNDSANPQNQQAGQQNAPAKQDNDKLKSGSDLAQKPKADSDNKSGSQAETSDRKTPVDPKTEAILRALPDDPGALLRRRMMLELQRRGQTEQQTDNDQHW